MGMNASRATNVVENSISSAVSSVLQSTAQCNTTVMGSNIISVANASGINISNVKQNVYLKMNATCIITQISDSKVTQKIAEQLQQQAESVTTGLGMNSADSYNYTQLMMKLAVAVQSSMIAQVNAISTGSNVITITDSSNVTMSVIDQEIYLETVTKNVVSQTMQSEIGQEAKVAIEQAATAKAEGFNLSMGLIVFIVAAIVASIFVVSWKNTITTVLMNPMTWLLVTTPILIGTSVLFIAGIPSKRVFWPYTQDVSTDTAAERSNRKSRNATIILASGVSTVFLTLLDFALFYATLKAPPSVAGQRSQQQVPR